MGAVADLSHTPACSAVSRSVSLRVSAMISAMASSTTERVLENGALNTATPRSAAAARSIWFVPMQKAPIAAQVGRGLEHPRGDLGLGPDAEQLDAVERSDELVLVQGAGAGGYLGAVRRAGCVVAGGGGSPAAGR